MIILGIVSFVILIPFAGVCLACAFMGNSHEAFRRRKPGHRRDGEQYLVFGLAILAASWLYFGSVESSAKGGNAGQDGHRHYVTDMTGNRISFAARPKVFREDPLTNDFDDRVSHGRFHKQEQALHDILAGCCRKEPLTGKDSPLLHFTCDQFIAMGTGVASFQTYAPVGTAGPGYRGTP